VSGETKSSISAWNVDTLKEHLESRLAALAYVGDERDRRYEDRFKAMDEKTGLALTSSKEAVAKAETATEKRFDAVNEFRGTLSDQAANLMPRGEAGARFDALEEKFAALKDEVTRAAGQGLGGRAMKDDQRANLAAIATIIGILGALAGWFLHR
jgi:hypothetical protein